MKPCQFHGHLKHGGHSSHLNRRDFLKAAAVTAAGLVVAGCQGQPAAPAASGGSLTASSPTVAIAKAADYSPELVKKQMQAMLDGIGGVADVLAHGKRVGIKVNLTGGVQTKPFPGTLEVDTFVTHPEVVKALIELLRDAGATEIFLLEAAYEPESWTQYGYAAVAQATGAKIVDLTDFAPYKSFTEVAAGTDPFHYEKFTFNPILTELDAFVSVSKMKCHNIAGVTHTLKNQFGLVPYRFYTMNDSDRHRSEFHGPSNETGKRVPEVIMDLNQARPVNLSIVDGIKSAEGGEGPWIQWFSPVKPGVMLAGKNPVATDAVATAAMGFDPTAEYSSEPFVNGRNHLALAASLGMGTNKLDEIKVVGEKIEDVVFKFKPSF